MQLGARHALGRAGFVDVDVRVGRADDGIARPGEARERDDVRAGTAEHGEHLHRCAEALPEGVGELRRPRVVAVGDRMTVVHARERVHHDRVHARRVVAGEGHRRRRRQIDHRPS